MKKIIVALLVLFVVGCSCKDKVVKVVVDNESVGTEETSSGYLYKKHGLLSYEIDNLQVYDEKSNKKDSFVLFVYSEYCSGCSALAPALAKYVEENQVRIYTLDYNEMSDKHELYKAGVNTTPYLILVDKGEIVFTELIKPSVTDDQENVELVKKWMKKHVEWGN